MKNKTGVLLINLGTPDSPSVPHVRSYLSQFLNDPRVIDIPWLSRKILVNLIIVPFRAPKSAAVYRKLWTANGSPLLYYSNRVKELESRFGVRLLRARGVTATLSPAEQAIFGRALGYGALALVLFGLGIAGLFYAPVMWGLALGWVALGAGPAWAILRALGPGLRRAAITSCCRD